MTKSKTAPRLFPLIFMLIAALWVVTTAGGRHIFVNEVLGEAFDSQAEHFLRGNVDVDGTAARHESIVVNGRDRIYFGAFPAFLRMPLNLIYSSGRGNWSRLSGFFAGVVGLLSFAGLLGDALLSSLLDSRARTWVGNACLLAFVFASPLFLLIGNPCIYNEAIIWGLAWSLAGLYFANRSRHLQGKDLTRSLLAFSLCAVFALHSRATFGVPLFLVAPLLALRLSRDERIVGLAVLFVPLAAGLVSYLLLSYARFGVFTGISLTHYINSTHRNFAVRHGLFDLRRVPLSFADYFSLRFPPFQHRAPFLVAARHSYNYPSLFVLPMSETYLSVLWCSSWLVLGAVFGVICLFSRDRADTFDRWVALALSTQFVCILSFDALAQRYATDLYPALIFSFLVFLRTGATMLVRVRYVIVGLAVISILINMATTISWLADTDQNPRDDTRAFWHFVIGRSPVADKF